MKTVSPDQMSFLESKAYRDGASELDFMEEAGSGVALIAQDYAETNGLDRQIVLLCGKGNNAGDAYVCGIQLLHLEYDVTAYQLFPIEECSSLCKQHQVDFVNAGGRYREVTSVEEVVIPSMGMIIDGIFGTGFHGAPPPHILSIIQFANATKVPIIAVDIPSGLHGENGQVSGGAIVATITAFLGLPKKGFFLENGWNYVGKLAYVDFGLPKDYIDEVKTDLLMLSPDMLRNLMPPLVRNRHKYQAGHVVGLAGSIEMPGAGLLASLSALCSGSGIVHLLYPEAMQGQLSTVPYELIKIPYPLNSPKVVLEWMNKASANFIGPGLGLSAEIRKLLKAVLPKLTKPCVIDADALTILAEEKIPLPENVILTPHIGEMKRLLGIDEIVLDMNFLKTCQKFAESKKVTLILKGGPSFIFHKGEMISVNPKGDPGMATAGSGDVLTGLIASLLAQGLKPHQAAMLGVYLHGLAGEAAALELTSYCMTASDLISYFPNVFRPNLWID